MNSTTPDRRAPHPSINVATDLQSTPQSLGSAARSKDLPITGVEAQQVHPWIARDIKDAKECETDLMLESCLLDCMTDDNQTMEDAAILFERCLKHVLPICDGDAKYDNSDEIKKQLEAYSKAPNETASYPCFTRAANIALLCLGSLVVDGLREAPKEYSDQLFFHVNRKEIAQLHGGQRSVRKPDVVLVSAADFSRGSATDAQRLDDADKCPKDNFRWRNIRTAVEFKHKRNVKGPPSSYTADYSAPSRGDEHSLQNSTDDLDAEKASSATGYSQGSEARSGSYRSKESGSAIAQNTGTTIRRKRKADASESEHQSQEVFRPPSNQGSGSRSKRLKAEDTQAEFKHVDPTVQLGTYGAEMFASHAGRHHVICLVIIGCDLTIWRYDRHGAIRSTKLNFIQHLPRFLVLLLAMQRFQNHHWGLHPKLDPNFGDLATPLNPQDSTMHIDDREKGSVDITLDCSSDTHVRHYGLNGRATNVYPATSEALESTEELVAKLYWAEESRMSEADILDRVYLIAEQEPDVKDHVPDKLFSCKFPGSSTATIRERLCLSTKGARVLYLIVFKRLQRITALYGKEFLTCWWHTVKCHLALWKHGVHHRDVSASNLMWKQGKDGVIGVLNDFDLSTTEGSVRGNERTGTIPFMAIDLLSEDGLAGKVGHSYAHDLESFIWVLVWVCLHYDNGKVREHPRPLDVWAKVDALTCREKKVTFLHKPPQVTVGRGHRDNWPLAFACLKMLRQYLSSSEPWLWVPSEPGTSSESETSLEPRTPLEPGTPELEPTQSKDSVQKTLWEPYNMLIGEPVRSMKSMYRNFMYFSPPCNAPWDSVTECPSS